MRSEKYFYVFSVALFGTFILASIISSKFIFAATSISFRILLVPLYIAWSTLVTYFLLLSAIRFNSIKINKTILLEAVIISDIVFLAQYVSELIWLLYNKKNYSFYDIINFSSLSLYQLYHPKNLLTHLTYPLQTINLWEIFYILTIVLLVKKLTDNKIHKIGRILTIAYFLGIFCWFIIVTFINLLNFYE